MQLTALSVQQILSAIIAVGGSFDPAIAHLGLFTALNNRGVDTLLSDLTLAPGSFASAVPLSAWRAVYPRPDGSWVADQAEKVFASGGEPDDCTVIGWYLADAASAGNLLGFGLLPSPRAIVNGGAPLTLVPRIVVSPNGPWEAFIFW